MVSFYRLKILFYVNSIGLILALFAGCEFEPHATVQEADKSLASGTHLNSKASVSDNLTIEAMAGGYLFMGSTMGTSYHVKVATVPLPANRQQKIAKVIAKTVAAVDNKMSTYKLDSELSLFNSRTTITPMTISVDTFAVLKMAREIGTASGGAFDISVGPLVNAWGFGAKASSVLPTAAKIAILKAHMGPNKWSISQVQVFNRAAAGEVESRQDEEGHQVAKSDPLIYLDLSAIAKGYAVDQVTEALMFLGYLNLMVEIGGEVASRGDKLDGSSWRIGIEMPSELGLATIIELKDKAMATSGDYRNYHTYSNSDGQRYSHTIDPRTGSPITHHLASVTVVDPTGSCARADAWATALSVLGPTEGMKLAGKLGLAALFLVRVLPADGEPHGMTHYRKIASPSFNRLIASPTESTERDDRTTLQNP